jgi:hypothetical protein
MDELNPVVLLSGATWHIVEHSRRSRQAWCGKALRERRAHARLSLVGEENVCPRCLARFRAAHESSDQG